MSPSAPVTVGIDIGTTSVKAVAVDSAGRILDRVRLPHPLLVPTPDRLEHDANRAWRLGPQRALRRFAAHRPAAVAVASMVPCFAAVDRRGKPLSAGPIYGDERGGREGDEGAGFVRWLAAEIPDAAGYWPSTAIANYALGGVGAVDIGTAFASGSLFDGEKWDASVCSAVGVDPSQLPDVAMPGTAVGKISGSDAVLGMGCVDVMCEQIVAGADQVDDVHVMCGTTLLIWAVTATEHRVPGLWTHPQGQSGNWTIGGASNAGGLFLDWANRLIGKVDDTTLDPSRVPVWSPYPRGERTPFNDRTRRASLHDLDLTHGPAAVQRAAWEAAGFVVRHHLDLAGITPRRIVATGGGTRVDGWTRALADCTGAPVHVAAEPEGAALGAAYLARVALAGGSQLEDSATWARTRKIIDPDPAWVPATNERYQRFRDLADGEARA